MYKHIKFITCVILCIVLTLSSVVLSFAQEDNTFVIFGGSSITQNGSTLKLYAQYNNVNVSPIWSIVSGGDIASISSNGVVTPFKNGQVVVCAVYNIEDSSSSVSATHTISIGNQTQAGKSAYLSVSVGSVGEIIRNMGLEDEVNWHQSKAGSFPVGTEFVLTANETSGEFLYWQDVNSRRVITTDKTYSFILGSDKTITAVFRAPFADYRFVTFMDKNGKILKSEYKNSGSFEVPSKPTLPGYTFDCWTLNGEKQAISAGNKIAFSEVTSDRIYVASYKQNSTLYTVLVTGGSGSGNYKYNDTVTAALDSAQIPEGKHFAYWAKDGVPVNSSEIYTFRVGSDTEVYAVYADSSFSEKVPFVIMNKATVAADEKKVTFLAERYLPLNYEFVETGIIMSMGSSFSLTTSGITKFVSTSSNGCGQFTAKKSISSSETTWYAKAYMIYKNDGVIYAVYSNVVEAAL